MHCAKIFSREYFICTCVSSAKFITRENFYIYGIYIYNYIYEKPISENNIGAPLAPQKLLSTSRIEITVTKNDSVMISAEPL